LEARWRLGMSHKSQYPSIQSFQVASLSRYNPLRPARRQFRPGFIVERRAQGANAMLWTKHRELCALCLKTVAGRYRHPRPKFKKSMAFKGTGRAKLLKNFTFLSSVSQLKSVFRRAYA
jgi:hypothetical protein